MSTRSPSYSAACSALRCLRCCQFPHKSQIPPRQYKYGPKSRGPIASSHSMGNRQHAIQTSHCPPRALDEDVPFHP